MKEPIEIVEATFDEEVLQATEPVVVMVWGTNCAPCHQIKPQYKAVANDHTFDSVKFTRLHAQTNFELAKGTLGIKRIPTFLVFYRGEKLLELNDIADFPQLSPFLDALLQKKAGDTQSWVDQARV